MDGELRPLSSFRFCPASLVAVAISRSFPEQLIFLSQVLTRIQLDHRFRQIRAYIVLDFFAFAARSQ
jgi:hypothetical protein